MVPKYSREGRTATARSRPESGTARPARDEGPLPARGVPNGRGTTTAGRSGTSEGVCRRGIAQAVVKSANAVEVSAHEVPDPLETASAGSEFRRRTREVSLRARAPKTRWTNTPGGRALNSASDEFPNRTGHARDVFPAGPRSLAAQFRQRAPRHGAGQAHFGSRAESANNAYAAASPACVNSMLSICRSVSGFGHSNAYTATSASPTRSLRHFSVASRKT